MGSTLKDWTSLVMDKFRITGLVVDWLQHKQQAIGGVYPARVRMFTCCLRPAYLPDSKCLFYVISMYTGLRLCGEAIRTSVTAHSNFKKTSGAGPESVTCRANDCPPME